MIDIARYSFERSGHTVIYENSAWSRAILDARLGANIGLVGASKSDKSSPLVFSEVEIGRSLNCFFVANNNHWYYDGVQSLSKVHLGTTDGYEFSAEIDAYLLTNKNSQRVQLISGDTSAIQNLKKLILGRVDVILGDDAVYHFESTRLKLSQKIKNAGCLPSDGNNYIAFFAINPNAKRYAEILSFGINELRRTGELKSILARYNMVDWRN